ncbi:23702_t:CDS:2, partial [Racocetra persica]
PGAKVKKLYDLIKSVYSEEYGEEDITKDEESEDEKAIEKQEKMQSTSSSELLTEPEEPTCESQIAYRNRKNISPIFASDSQREQKEVDFNRQTDQ